MNGRPRGRFAVLLAACIAFGSTAAGAQPAPQLETLLSRGQAAFDARDFTHAAGFWQQALPALEKADDPRTGDVLFDVGLCYQYLGDETRALASYRQALTIHRLLKRRDGEATDLANIGVIEEDRAQYEDALASEQQALTINRELANVAGEADDRTNIGLIENDLGRYADGLAALQAALTIHRRLGNHASEALDLRDLGIAQEGLGRYADALTAQTQALALDRAASDKLGEAGDLGNIGNVQQSLGRYDDALDSHQQALAIHRELHDAAGEARDLQNIGNDDESVGRFDAALESYHEALSLDRARKNRLGEADDAGNIGIVERHLGRYDEALAFHEQALAIHRAIASRAGEARDLGNIGTVEEGLGRYSDALASEQAALVLDRATGNRPGEAGDLTNIGVLQSDLDQYADALATHQQALTLLRELRDRRGEALSLGDVGYLQAYAGRTQDALATYAQTLSIDRELGNRHGQSNDLVNLANVDALLGHFDDALASAHEALALQRQLEDPEGIWRSLAVAARADAHLGHRDAALAGYDAAIAQIESLRSGLSGTERGGFFANKLFLYDEYVAYLLELDRLSPGSGYARKALEIFERKSARAALEQIGQSAAQHFRGVPRSVVDAEAAAGASLASAQSRLAAALSSSGAEPAALAAAQKAVAGAQAHVADLDANVKAHYPAYAELRRPEPLLARCDQAPCTTIASFQQSVLRPGELLLEYDLLEGQSVLWAIDRDRVQVFALAPSGQIDAAVARLNAHVAGMLAPGIRLAKLERQAAADLPLFAADSYALYRMLVPEAAADALAHAKNVIVVPSGSLYRLAFETLVTKQPAAGEAPHYLIEDAALSYIPSASLLAVVRAAYAKRTAGRNPLLAFANPAFGAEAPPQTAGPSATYAGLQLASARAAFAGGVFPALPGTRTEAEAVRQRLGAPSDSVLDGEAASRARLLALNAGDALTKYRYLLFATHAVLPSELVGLSQPAIVLAHPERGDGLLTMADVFGLSLDADFVMLSACNTGVATGDSSGEGISGLTRAFLYAGTPALAVTLWEVDDAAAPQITPAFFGTMYAGKLSPAQALRRAKLAMLTSAQARFRHPYAWAPGVVFGDGDRAE